MCLFVQMLNNLVFLSHSCCKDEKEIEDSICECLILLVNSFRMVNVNNKIKRIIFKTKMP